MTDLSWAILTTYRKSFLVWHYDCNFELSNDHISGLSKIRADKYCSTERVTSLKTFGSPRRRHLAFDRCAYYRDWLLGRSAIQFRTGEHSF